MNTVRHPARSAPREVAGSHIRPATIDDVDAIWAIEASVFGADAWSHDMMREELGADHRNYLVLTDASDEIIGYGGLLAVGGDGDIQTIALTPEARGQGLGRCIMDSLLDAGADRGVRAVFLEVRADNPVAQGMYASMGFAEIGVRPHYYQPGSVDAIVMKLEMKDRR